MDAVASCVHFGRPQVAQNIATSLTFCLMPLIYLDCHFFLPKSIFFLLVHETETTHLLPLSVVLFCRSFFSNCVRSYTTSEHVELEIPTNSRENKSGLICMCSYVHSF